MQNRLNGGKVVFAGIDFVVDEGMGDFDLAALDGEHIDAALLAIGLAGHFVHAVHAVINIDVGGKAE